jgi:hypothetical protein
MADNVRGSDELAQDPLPLALLACESVYRDSLSQRLTLLGLFRGLYAEAFPCHVSFFVYFAFTDALPGQTAITVRVVDSEEDREPVFESDSLMEVDDSRAVIEMIVPVDVEFLLPGEYRIQSRVGANILLERRIEILETSEQGEDDEQ